MSTRTEALRPAATLTRSRRRIPMSTVANYAILSVVAIAMIAPFYWMITSAFKDNTAIIAYPPEWIPQNPTFDNIVKVWTEVNFARYFANSLFVATTVTVLILFTSSLVGFVLAKYDFRGRNLIFTGILSTMMIPWPVLLIPSYQMIVWLNLMNSYWALIVPAAFNSFGIFLMRQYMHSVPDELLDAARIDGSSEPGIYFRIVLPLVGPALGALAILEFLWHWDNFLWPLIVLNRKELFTLPLGLRQFSTEFYTDNAAVMAGTAIAVVPVLVVFILFQRYIITGIALTGMKA